MNIIIIGAGLSGIYSGYLLQKIGHKVTILEARNRIGGRIYTNNEKRIAVDLGAQWIGPPQKRIMNLLKEFNIPIIKQYEEGNHILHLSSHITTYSGNIAVYDDNMTNFIKKLDELAFNSELYRKLDNVTIKYWIMNNNIDKLMQELFELTIHIDLGWDIENISFYFLLYFIKSCGGYNNITSKMGGAQEYKIKNGAIQLVSHLASTLDIKLNEAVYDVHQYSNKCIVKSNNDEYTGDIVIVSIPPQFNKSINYFPSLPEDKYNLYNGLRMSKVKKYVIVYEQPFWRELGFSGEILSNAYPIQLSLDYSTDNYYALVCFICDKWLHNAPPKNDILQALAKYFNDDRALKPKLCFEKDWSKDEWSHGCYFTVPNLNIISKYQKSLQTQFERIYWTGAETANEWVGYMEGALESAERVVKQISAHQKIN